MLTEAETEEFNGIYLLFSWTIDTTFELIDLNESGEEEENTGKTSKLVEKFQEEEVAWRWKNRRRRTGPARVEGR